MRVKRLILPTLTMVIIASQLMGCAATSQSELLKMLNEGQQIEIEIAVPTFAEQGEEQAISWTQLDQLTTYLDFRNFMDDLMKITSFGEGSKNGICYINLDGEQEGNNTLFGALQNRKFVANFLDNDTANLEVQQQINSLYADVEESEAMVAAINAYWNLLPDAEPNYFNGGSTVTRLEAMSLLARATTPVTEEVSNQAFTDAVGQTDFTDLASLVASDSYLTTSDKSLNDTTASGTITRGEYIYMLISNVFGQDRMSSADIKKAQFNDCKNAGDIATSQKVEDTSADYLESAILKVAISNPDDGCPERMYQALAAAQELGIISSETRWDEGLTKAEAIQLFIDTLQAYTKQNGYAVDALTGTGDNTIVETPIEQDQNTETDETIVDEETGIGINEDDMIADMLDADNNINSEYEIIPMEEQVGYIVSNKANVRSGPSTDYDIVDSMAYGESAVFNGYVEEGDSVWYVIKTDNEEDVRMISKSLISSTKPQPQQSSGNGGGSSAQQPSGGGDQPSGGGQQSGGGEPQGNTSADNPYADSSAPGGFFIPGAGGNATGWGDGSGDGSGAGIGNLQ